MSLYRLPPSSARLHSSCGLCISICGSEALLWQAHRASLPPAFSRVSLLSLFFGSSAMAHSTQFQEVPQVPYTVTRSFTSFPSIRFDLYGSLGVSLGRALRNELGDLQHPDYTPVLTNTAKKVTLRINVRLAPCFLICITLRNDLLIIARLFITL